MNYLVVSQCEESGDFPSVSLFHFLLLFFKGTDGCNCFPGGSVVKNLPANSEDTGDAGLIPGLEDPLEEEMTTHSSILAWRIP